ncbi:MAG: DUF2027 domain-containing protein [Bacteroidia bacterium]|nr:DUF2027 domain-containing protein [Bacteroidia bacterium]
MIREFRIGDKVSFLNEVGKGVVCGFKNDLIIVKLDNGLEVPYSPDSLIKVGHEEIKHSDLSDFQDDYPTDKKSSVFVVIEPDSMEIKFDSNFNIFLVNRSSYSLYLNVLREEESSKYKRIFNHTGSAYQKIHVGKFSFRDFMEYNRLKFEILFYKTGIPFAPIAPLSETVFLNENKLKNLQRVKIPGFQNSVFLFVLKEWDDHTKKREEENETYAKQKLDSEILKKLKEKAFSGFESPVEGKTRLVTKKGIMEIDLHSEKLGIQKKKLNDFEILNYQLSFFEQKLNEAITQGYEKLVVIHGKGSGRLKQEVLRITREIYGLRYEENRHDHYAGGASIIILG